MMAATRTHAEGAPETPGHRWLEVAAMMRAEWYLLRARLSLLLAPRGRLLAALPGAGGGGVPTPGQITAQGVVRARGLALAIDRAARYGVFRPTCLVRAIALERMLTRDGVSGAVVRIGARRREGRAEMHAWIEMGGTAVGERPEVIGTFTPLHDFTAVGRS